MTGFWVIFFNLIFHKIDENGSKWPKLRVFDQKLTIRLRRPHLYCPACGFSIYIGDLEYKKHIKLGPPRPPTSILISSTWGVGPLRIHTAPPPNGQLRPGGRRVINFYVFSPLIDLYMQVNDFSSSKKLLPAFKNGIYNFQASLHVFSKL